MRDHELTRTSYTGRSVPWSYLTMVGAYGSTPTKPRTSLVAAGRLDTSDGVVGTGEILARVSSFVRVTKRFGLVSCKDYERYRCEIVQSRVIIQN